jgi:hypothetical protein
METKAARNKRMSEAFHAMAETIPGYDEDPEAFEIALDELMASLGSIGASMGSPDPSETLEPAKTERDDPARQSLRLQMLWLAPDKLPQSLRGPLYPVTISESRWRKLPKELRAAITYYRFKREIIGRSAQYTYEQLDDSNLAQEQLAAFEQAMLAYA